MLVTAGALAGVLLVVLVAPALSAGRWEPDPVDFEMAPSQAAAMAAGGPVRSRPLTAPARFNLLGLRWRGRSEPRVAVRVRRDGRNWSRWQRLEAHADHNPDGGTRERPVAASDPVWVGEADQLQYRLSRRVPGLRIHFVNVKGTATAGDRVRTAMRRVANTAVSTLAAGLGGDSANAQAPDAEPPIVHRRDWGASKCPPRARPEYGTVRAGYVHHTVSLNDYTPEEAPSIVLAICRYHRNSNGWNDIGYQALVDKYGALYEGRAGGLDRAVIGAQAQGFNAETTGVASIGDNTSQPLPDVAMEALAGYLRWKLAVHGVPLSGRVTLTSAGGESSRYAAGRRVTVPRVLGHRDTNSTACPGSALYAQLDDLRARVATGVPLPGVPTIASAELSTARTAYGGRVAVSGTLTTELGQALTGLPVKLQVLRGERWHTLTTLTTDASGAWASTVVPRGTRLLRATYPGSPEWRRSYSPEMLLRVAPVVTLGRTAATGIKGRRFRVSGRITPRKTIVYQVLQQRIRGSYRKVGTRAVRVRGGRFRSSFAPGYTGLYRVYVVALADGSTDRGRSQLRVIRVARR